MTPNFKFIFQSPLDFFRWLYQSSFKVNWQCVVGNLSLAIACSIAFTPVWAESPEQTWQALWKKFESLSSGNIDSEDRDVVASALIELSRNENLTTLNDAVQFQKLGENFDNKNQPALALPLKLRALEIIEKVQGPDHPDTAVAYTNLAHTYYSLGKYSEALELGGKALLIDQKTFGNEHPNVATDLSNLAATYNQVGQYDVGLNLNLRALSIREKALGLSHPDTLMSLSNLAANYNDQGRYNEALALNIRVLTIRQETLNDNHPDILLSLNNLAHTYERLAQYDKALELELRILNMRKKIYGQNNIETGYSLDSLATTYGAIGRYDMALQYGLESISIFEKTYGSENPETLRVLNNLATTYSHLNAPEKALPLLQRVVSAYENTFSMETPNAAQALNNLSIIYGELGQPDKMLPLAIQALTIREKVLGVNHPDVAESMGNLADVYSELGQGEKAIEFDLKALSVCKKIFGEMHPRTAQVLLNLGAHYSMLSKYEAALDYEKVAYEVNKKTLGPLHPVTALTMSNLAQIYFSLGEFENSLRLNLSALKIREEISGRDHPLTAISQNNLAANYGRLGQFEKALELQIQAIATLAANAETDQTRTAFAMFNMAGLLEKMGQSSAAIVWGKKGVNIYQSIRAKVAELGQISLTAYTESIESHYQDLASALTVQGRLAEAQQVLDMLKEDEQFELIRRSALDDPRRTRVGYTPTEERWVMRYDEISHRLAELGNEDRELKRAAKQGNLSLTQRQRQQTLAADLAVARKAFVTYTAELQSFYSARGPAGMDDKEETSLRTQRELQNLIGSLSDSSGSGVALVQYFMTDEQVTILLTTPGVQLTRNSKVKAGDLNHMVADFRRQLRDPKSQPLAASQALYQLLVAPIANDLQQAGAQTVMLSLNGALRYLPFAALHDGKQYLAQRWSLPIYTSVVRDRLRDAVHTHWQAAGLGVTRAIADFPALPSVRAEMRSIVKTDAQATGVLPGEVYLDDAFSAARLKAVGQSSFELLHVASHFRFSPGTEVNSYLLLGDGQRLTLGDIRTQNYRFDQVDLLTLSACETGLGGGRDEKGREIEGFGVIAQQQGAKAVLATLWPVADSSTADLMADMYRRRQTLGLNKAEALRQAQVAMLQGKYSHPFYWAPFILMGNWK